MAKAGGLSPWPCLAALPEILTLPPRVGVSIVAIYRLLRNLTFEPREIARMTAAYEMVLVELGITNRADDRTESIALAIIHRARAGEGTVRGLADFAIRQVQPASGEAPAAIDMPDSAPKATPRNKSD